jgi:PAS domain S-box-containing protein
MHSFPQRPSKGKARRHSEASAGGPSTESDFFEMSGGAAERNLSPPSLVPDSAEPDIMSSTHQPPNPESAEDSLRALDSHFESTFHHAAVGMAHVDKAGRFLRVNRKFAQIVGYSREELLQMTFMQLTDAGVVVKDLIGFQELLNGSRESYSREKRYLRKDGSHVWCNVDVSLLRSPDPECDCFVVVLHDISARKEIEDDLARTNELLTISQAAGGTGSFEWIIRENSLAWSENHIKMFGLSSSGFDGSFAAWKKCVLPDDLANVEAQIQSAFTDRREDWHTEYRILRPDTSEQRWITSRGRISYDSRGKPLIMVGISIDTTDRKIAEQELLRSREDLEQHVHQRTTELVQKTLEMSEQARQLDQANESLRQLSARILQLQDEERRRIASHLHDSTGGWITALAMNLSVVQSEGTNLSAKAKNVLADSLEIIRDMSNDLRTVSHLLHPPLLDELGLHSALRWFVEEFSKRSNIPVELELASNLGRLSRECETAIFRIVQEALTNVHRHSGSPRASICITRDAEEIVLEVRDWGKGLAVVPDGNSDRPGVGLQGMRERVRQLGGHFEAHTNPDGGASVIAKFDAESVCLPTPD